MYRPFLAGRYLFARPVSYLAIFAIGIGVGALITVVSVMNGFLRETRSIVRGTTADITVLPVQHPSEGLVASQSAYEAVVKGYPGVVGVTSRLVRPAVVKVHGRENLSLNDAMVGQSGHINQVMVMGVDPVAESRFTDFTHYAEQVYDDSLKVKEVQEAAAASPPRAPDPARLFALDRKLIRDRRLANADLPRILVGEQRMLLQQLQPGDALELVTLPDDVDLSGATLASRTETFVVAGAFRTGKYDFDVNHVFVTTPDFKAWSGTRQEFSEMAVTATDPTQLPALRDGLNRTLERAGLPVLVATWEDRYAVYLGAVENERNILAFVLGLFVLLTCTITFSMLTMMVQEKVRDIGILSAMGAPALGIGAIFATCGLFVSALGGLFGFVAGEALARNVDAVKNWIESTFHIEIFNKEVYAFTTLPSEVNSWLDAKVLLVTVAFSVLICLLPAWRAARLDPVDALRHE